MVDQMLDCKSHMYIRIFMLLTIFFISPGLHDLRYKANILHRDVSVNNIMYEMRGDNYYFILIDYDMGAVLPTGDQSSYKVSSKHRTGTLPFMARALIQDAWLTSQAEGHRNHIKHLLCHDFESLFWVSLWCPHMLPMAGLSSRRIKILQTEARSWELGTLNSIWGIKFKTCLVPLAVSEITLPKPAAHLADWFEAWIDLFNRAHSTELAHQRLNSDRQKKGEDPEPWDAETIGGTFTRDTIKIALTPVMPFRQPDVDDGEDEAVHTPEPPSRTEKTTERPTRSRMQRVQQVFSPIRARLRPRK